jgi:hypothetical protein
LRVSEKLLQCPLCGAKFSTIADFQAHLQSHKQGETSYVPPEWVKDIPERAVVAEGPNEFILTGRVEVGPNPNNPERKRMIIYTESGILYTGSLAIMQAIKKAAEKGPIAGKRLKFTAVGSGPARRYRDVSVD